MRILFWLLLLVWLISVGFRSVVIGLLEHSGRYMAAYWGTRFDGLHYGVEALLVAFLGYVIFKRVELWGGLAFLLGLVLLIALPVLHYASVSWEIGHTVRATIAGKQHEVDWVYDPHHRRQESSLMLRLIYPGYLPQKASNTSGQMRLNFQKSERPYWNKSIFNFEADEGRPECIEDLYNRYCRFFVDGAWYWVHHQRPSGPPLEELMIEIPALYDSFVVPR